MYTWYAVRHQQLHSLRAAIICLTVQVFALEFLRSGWTNLLFQSENDTRLPGLEDLFVRPWLLGTPVF